MSFKLFRGRVIHAKSFNSLELIDNALLSVHIKTGQIEFLKKSRESLTSEEADIRRYSQIVDLTSNQFIIPGFVDTHAHAPQYVNAGTGLDLPLLEWLNTYTFPKEAKFSSIDYAKKAYTHSIKKHLKNGTTTCCYFATIHRDSSVLLAKIINKLGQRAIVGKVCCKKIFF